MTEQEPVTQFSTGLLRTTVLAAPSGGFEWRRAPGPLAPQPFEPANSTLHERVGQLSRHDARLVLGVADGETRVYRVGGAQSVASQLLREGVLPELRVPLRDLGRALRAIHSAQPPVMGRSRHSRGLVRLDDWLSGRVPSATVAHAEILLRQRLGGEKWMMVRDWCGQVREDGEVALAHGAPGLGSLVVDLATDGAELLVGEDLCLAPWYFDLGWVVGELVELRWCLGGDPATWQSLLEALFDGYGRDLGPDWNRMVVLRILLHVHDFTAYAGWNATEVKRYAGFLAFLLDQ